MGLYINTNIAASGTSSTLRAQSDKLSQSQQRLATGVKSVSDDAASASVGFALEATISSLTQATSNATQAGALLQYAMSTLSSTQEILNRMNQLTAQANSNAIDDTRRQMLDKDFQALLSQVDTNSQNSWFSTQLFTGGAGTATGTAFPRGNSTLASVAATMSNSFGTTGFVHGEVTAASATATGGANQYTVSMTIGSQTFASEVTITGANTMAFTLASTSNPLNTVTLTTGAGANNTTITNASVFTSALQGVFGVNTVTPQVLGSTTVAAVGGISALNGGSATAGMYGLSYAAGTNGGTFTLTNGGQSWSQAVTSSASAQTVTFANGVSFTLGGSGTFAFATSFMNDQSLGVNVVAGTGNQSFTFQIGQAATNTISVTFNGAGISALGLTGLSVATTGQAQTATTAILAAMTTISNQIATLGGTNDQLTYIVDNLTASIQNQNAAKSTFTDVDVAEALISVQQLNAQITVAQTMFTQSIQAFADKADLVQAAAR